MAWMATNKSVASVECGAFDGSRISMLFAASL